MYHTWAHLPGQYYGAKNEEVLSAQPLLICILPHLSNSGVQDSCTARSLKIYVTLMVFPRLATILPC